jgi:porphobilinogen deaminase
MELAAAVASLDGAASVTGRTSGPPRDAVMLGRGLAGDLLARGGEAILAAIRAEQGAGGSPG